MNTKVFLIHARNQIRTTWLMTKFSFASPYDIQTHNPALKFSFIALFAAYVLTGIYDYLDYPSELLGGYIEEGVTRGTYVAANTLSYFSGLALSYFLLFLLAVPLGYSKRFWYGLIAFNWWGLVTTFAFFPLLLATLMLDENDPFFSPFVALLILTVIALLWMTLNLQRHSLRVSMMKAALLFVLAVITQVGAAVLIMQQFGITLFGADIS